MSENIIIALITGGLAVISNLVSNKSTKNEIQNQIITHQAVTDTKIEELTREVRAHNNFAQRMPVVENEIVNIHNELRRLSSYHQPN